MHPYKELGYRAYLSESLSPRDIALLRLFAILELLLGFTITTLESIAYMLEGNVEHPFVSGMGVVSGISVVFAGLCALLNSRRWTSDGRTRCIAISHIAVGIMAAVNTLLIFIIRCMNLPLVPLTGYFDNSMGQVPPEQDNQLLKALPWWDEENLKYVSLVLYIVSFMTLGASIGVGVAVYRTVASWLADAGNSDGHSVLVSEMSVSRSVIAGNADGDKERKAATVTNIEATVNGLYRRLQEEDEEY
ncbi:uncharacterized protein LOC129588118 [Paramacrobiotus metropolitanus]|uniref:uncharacterized protein LOC129588118 n=1 Tax=Paramacrobiotus metropolitanus TaxID=2943436 RepID=UPI0024461CB3|nr:uncharacterized protein LOC129588118 [Paramacrobiotus metropolitanus]XP_055338172.1 uncharacterized protein LOC129588118 [Paramacrobiotus metropolitanus]